MSVAAGYLLAAEAIDDTLDGSGRTICVVLPQKWRSTRVVLE